MTPTDRAVVLFAHGSRDPAWRNAVDAVARRARLLAPEVPLRCAFLEMMAPTLPEAAQELVAAGTRRIDVVPMFLGVGRHLREDLPRLMAALQQAHPDVEWRLRTPLGEEDRVVQLMAEIALS